MTGLSVSKVVGAGTTPLSPTTSCKAPHHIRCLETRGSIHYEELLLGPSIFEAVGVVL